MTSNREIFDGMRETFRSSAVDVSSIRDDGEARLHGSGLLVDLNGQPFVLTATHVITEARQFSPWLIHHRGNGLDVGTYPGLSAAIILSDQPEVERDSLYCDVSLLAVDPSCLSEAQIQPFSLSLEAVTIPKDLDDEDLFYYIGFPQESSRQSGIAGGQVHGQAAGVATLGEPPAWFEPGLHFSLAYAPETTDLIEVEGDDPADPPGMSGCPVWWTGATAQGTEWTPQDARLLGVLHTLRRGDFSLTGTRLHHIWDHVLEAAAALSSTSETQSTDPTQPY